MQNNQSTLARDGEPESTWQHGQTSADIQPNQASALVYDCLIVGGGITGLTAALRLQQAGKKTIIAEAYTLGFGTTGGTSAHINTFADTTYPEAESAFGEEGAKLFAQAINGGLNIIAENVKQYKIDCDYEIKDGYLYAEDDDQVKELDEIVQGTQKVGVAIDYINKVPVPIGFKKAAKLPGQAQFHPLKYLTALAEAYVKAGGIILEHTQIEDIESTDGVNTAKAANGSIKASNVIYATHSAKGLSVFDMRCAPYRSYVLGVELKDNNYPDALVYDMQEPYHYFRTHRIDGKPLLIVGGNDHKTGHDDPEQAFADLEAYVRKYYQVAEVKYKWSSQYYVPVDGLPYIGQMPMRADGIYCATGYNGNGMMLGTISGAILSDIISGVENPLADLLSTKRLKPVDGFMEFVKENADVAYHFVADRLSVEEVDSLKSLQPGTGEVVKFEGKKVAAYRDENGTLHTLSPTCTHAGCIVSFNSQEKSWDCPCHGARYDLNGDVITGPATKALAKIDM